MIVEPFSFRCAAIKNCITREEEEKEKLMRPTHDELHNLTKKLSVPSEELLKEERDER